MSIQRSTILKSHKWSSLFVSILAGFQPVLVSCGGGGGGGGDSSGSPGDWETKTRSFYAVITGDIDIDGVTDTVFTDFRFSERYVCDRRDGNLECNHDQAWEFGAVVYLQEALNPGKFTKGMEYNLASRAYSLQSGDLDQDGIPDLAIAQMLDETVRVLLNDTGDPCRFATQYDFDVAIQPGCIAIGELNGDTLIDMVVAGGDLVLLENSAATPGESFDARSLGMQNIYCVSVADIDGDGRNDLAATSEDQVIVRLQVQAPAAAGGFLPGSSYQTDAVASDVAIHDLNNDSLPDLAVAIRGETDGGVSVHMQDPLNTGTFLPAVSYPNAMTARAVVIGDLNNDHHPDLALANDGPGGGSISVLLQDTRFPGTFLPAVDYPGLNGPKDVAIGDMNGDGFADLVVADNSTLPTGPAYILYQDTSKPGTFLGRTPLPW
jgi:hypothetical protein